MRRIALVCLLLTAALPAHADIASGKQRALTGLDHYDAAIAAQKAGETAADAGDTATYCSKFLEASDNYGMAIWELDAAAEELNDGAPDVAATARATVEEAATKKAVVELMRELDCPA